MQLKQRNREQEVLMVLFTVVTVLLMYFVGAWIIIPCAIIGGHMVYSVSDFEKARREEKRARARRT
jgi:hypothetical protein